MSNKRRILKHPLEIADTQVLELDSCSCLLSVANQGGQLVLYATDDGDHQYRLERSVTITLIGTGNPFPDNFTGIFIGTVIMGHFVWHVYWS